MSVLSGFMLFVVGVIHLLPIVGVLGADQLKGLYGTELRDTNLILLMQHRAVLFGLLGGFLAIAAFVGYLRWAAYLAGFISVVSFLVLSHLHGDYNEFIKKVVIADIIALGFLMVGCSLEFFKKSFESSNSFSI